MVAVNNDRTEVVRLLLENTNIVDVDAKRPSDGATALMLALAEGETDISKLLLDHGADINVKDSGGRTAFAYATAFDMKAVLESSPQWMAMGKEKAGDAAAQQGKLREALQNYKEGRLALSQSPPTLVDRDLREKIYKLHASLSAQDENAGNAALKQGKGGEAVQDYQDALHDLPDDVPSEVRRSLQEQIVKVKTQPSIEEEDAGDAALKEKRLAIALFDYQNAIGILPDDAPAAVKGSLWGKVAHVEEAMGDDATEEGQPREAFQRYLDAFQLQWSPGSDIDERLREKIIKAVLLLNPPPAIPQDAIRHVVYAKTAMEQAEKDANPSHLVDAILELQNALEIAPWWGPRYLDLATLLKKANRPGEAARALQLYLLADPHAANVQDVQMEIYKLEYEAKQAQQ